MTVEDIYLKLRDELTADNESSSSPERIFIKNDEQTICTLGMNRSHEIIFVEFKPSPKDLPDIEREGFVHPHPVEMLHDAGWRQAQITVWEEAEKLLEIIHRSYKKKRVRPSEEGAGGKRRKGGKALRIKRGMAGIATRSASPSSAKEMRDRKGGKREASKEVRPMKAAVKTAKPTAKKKPAVQSKKAPKAKAKTSAAKKKAPAKKKTSKKRK